MKTILLYALSLLAGFTMCAGEIVVHESPEWRPVSGAILKQYEEQGLRKDLVDAAYFTDGTYASVVKFSLSAENSADSFRNLIAGIMHAAEKQNFHSVKHEVKNDSPFPRTVYLFEGTKNGALKRILIY